MDPARTFFILAALIQLVIWAIVIFRPVKDPPGRVVLRYGPILRGFGICVAFAIPLLLIAAMLSYLFSSLGHLVFLGGSLLVLGLIGGVLLLETQITRIAVADHGVVGRSPWRPLRNFNWGDIRTVSYSTLDHCLILHGPKRYAIRASLYLIHIADLSRAIKENLPGDRYASVIKRLK